jgi:ATP-binding cassette, subfamily B (MDR/TAP), member 10
VVNTLGDLRGTLAAVERINGILTAHEIDESLAYGLNREQENLKIDDFHRTKGANAHYMAALRSGNGCGSLARFGDICLEG